MRLDKDNNGFLDLEELSALSACLDHLMTDAEKQTMFAIMDTDADSKISLDEFIDWWLTEKSDFGV